MSETKSHPEAEMKGWLFKWTNYLKGYQKRWFVLTNGLLSYYRNQAEMAHTCRGTISLQGAMIHTEDSCMFVISNGGTQTFHIKASNEVERQRWVTALELAKAKAIRTYESEEEEEEDFENASKSESTAIMKDLTSHLEDIQTCSDLIAKHGIALQRALTELENVDSASDASAKIKTVNERATLFRITSNAMMNTCKEYMNLAQAQERNWEKILQHERSQKLRLEEMVEQLARQHDILEQAAKDHRIPKNNSPSDDEDGTEFYECEENTHNSEENFVIKVPNCQTKHSLTVSTVAQNDCEEVQDGGSYSSSETEEPGETEVVIRSTVASSDRGKKKKATVNIPVQQQQQQGKKQRRTSVPPKPYYPLNLWSIMKNCIGKDLSKIAMPVNFSEPLSMLQRLTEDYEYANVLDAAAEISDDMEQLAYVAAFTISSYSTTSNRTGKPFNPLLGETYECDRTDDLGWKAISEQVSHHPPVVAQHCEGAKWKCWQEFTMSSKFRGKYLQITPQGTAHLEFSTGQHYTWRKVTTTVHNIIVGKLWVDQHGDMDIINIKNGQKCRLNYIPYSYFNRDVQRKVKGCVMDTDGKVSWVVNGTWDSKIEIAPVICNDGTVENPIYKTGPYTVAWERNEPPPDSDKYYNFTLLACQLNEPEPGVAPTDSRNRPDQRLMEQGKWDEANAVKLQLEEKQRAERKKRDLTREEEGQGYEPAWFGKEIDPHTGTSTHVFLGEYWKCKEQQDWSRCPNIF